MPKHPNQITDKTGTERIVAQALLPGIEYILRRVQEDLHRCQMIAGHEPNVSDSYLATVTGPEPDPEPTSKPDRKTDRKTEDWRKRLSRLAKKRFKQMTPYQRRQRLKALREGKERAAAKRGNLPKN